MQLIDFIFMNNYLWMLAALLFFGTMFFPSWFTLKILPTPVMFGKDKLGDEYYVSQ